MCLLECFVCYVALKLSRIGVCKFSLVHLPSLKTLHLDQVLFPQRQYLMDLLAGYPILEYMNLGEMIYINHDYHIPSNNKFGSLSKLVRAYIHHDIIKTIGIDKDLDGIPLFPNLTHVELSWRRDRYWQSDMCWHSVLAMLKHCPMLQNFVLDMQRSSNDSNHLVWISPSSVPECLSSRLRKCSIINYGGTESELHFAKYIMQNSRVLRTLTICTVCSSELTVDKLELLKQLSSCPRSSTICKLSFK